jgi:hypothetical protein
MLLMVSSSRVAAQAYRGKKATLQESNEALRSELAC